MLLPYCRNQKYQTFITINLIRQLAIGKYGEAFTLNTAHNEYITMSEHEKRTHAHASIIYEARRT